MKMEWFADGLSVNGLQLAHVFSHNMKVWGFHTRMEGTMSGEYSSREAAKAAAEQAVIKWFREVMGEPVAWAVATPIGIGYHGTQDAAEQVARLSAAQAVPLYALPSKEEGE